MPPSQDQPTPDQQPSTYPPMPQTTELFAPDQLATAPSKKPLLTNKTLLILILVLIVIGSGIYGYLKLTSKKPVAKTTVPKSTATASPTKSGIDSVIYYSQAKSTEPYSIYSQPIAGGSPQKVLTLDQKTGDSYYFIGSQDVNGQDIVFDSNDGIYISRDGGKSFKNIYKIKPGSNLADPNSANSTTTDPTITSLKFSEDGKKIVFAFLPSYGGNADVKNSVKVIDLDGQNLKDIHSFDAPGVFIDNYDSENQQLIYAAGCYFCDGGHSYQRLMDLKTGKDKELFNVDISNQSQVFATSAVSKNGQQLIYAIGTSDAQLLADQGGLGWEGGPPYKIMQVDVATGKSTQIATFGTLHEKDSDGKLKSYFLQLGFTDDSQKPYYVAGNKIYVVDGTTSNLIYEAKKDVWYLAYISKDELVVGVDTSNPPTSYSNYDLYLYDIASKKTTSTIYSVNGENSISTIGVTTK